MKLREIFPQSWKIRLYNDGIYYYPIFKDPVATSILEFIPWCIAKKFLRVLVREKVVELPFILLNIPKKRKDVKILEVGCTGGIISIMLASLGYKVVGVDLRDFPLSHPNFTFIKGNFLKLKIKEKFDVVISISTIEHFGMKHYDKTNEEIDLKADEKAIRKIRKILKKNGIFLVTFPFGKKCRTSWYRVYDFETLQRLFRGFRIEKMEFYKADEHSQYWIRSKRKEIEKIDSCKKNYSLGVVCIKAKKI